MTHSEAHAILFDEFRAALMADPNVIVAAPGYPRRETAAEVIADNMTPAEVCTLLRIVASAAKSGNTEAQAWIDSQATAHARYHESDMVAETDEGDA